MAAERQTEQEFTDRFHGGEIYRNLNPTAPVETGSTIYADMENYRQSVFESLPNRTEGINTAQISDYIAKRGLKERPYILLSDGDIPKFNEIAGAHGMPHFPAPADGNTHYGVVSMGTDFAQIYRSQEMEIKFGTAFTEAMIVHELAHASSNWNEWTITHKGPDSRGMQPKRLGQIVRSSYSSGKPDFRGNEMHGSFIEEGFAQFMANDYLAATSQPMAPGYVDALYSNMASKSIEEIMKIEPGFLDTLIEARDNVDGLRRVAKTLNQIRPHLYDDLTNVPYTEKGYFEGYGRVLQAVSSYTD